MTKRTITIEVDIEGSPSGQASTVGNAHDERYADLANSVWMMMRSAVGPHVYVYPDSPASVAQLNARWDGYTENGAVIWK